MSAPFAQSNRVVRLVAACVAIAGAVACSDDSPTADPNAQLALTLRDTITGSGQLSELQQHRAAWLLRGIGDYRFQLQISCFCGSEITRPVVVEVRGGAIATVEDLATGKPVADKSAYPTITTLFDAAIAKRSGGGTVSVAYDRTLGIPMRLEVGTLANDAGILYLIGSLVRL
jgi:Family of unknown function (DUF6174)